MQSVSDTKWSFYEAKEAEDLDTMASNFETLLIYYKKRGKRIKNLMNGGKTNGTKRQKI